MQVSLSIIVLSNKRVDHYHLCCRRATQGCSLLHEYWFQGVEVVQIKESVNPRVHFLIQRVRKSLTAHPTLKRLFGRVCSIMTFKTGRCGKFLPTHVTIIGLSACILCMLFEMIIKKGR